MILHNWLLSFKVITRNCRCSSLSPLSLSPLYPSPYLPPSLTSLLFQVYHIISLLSLFTTLLHRMLVPEVARTVVTSHLLSFINTWISNRVKHYLPSFCREVKIVGLWYNSTVKSYYNLIFIRPCILYTDSKLLPISIIPITPLLNIFTSAYVYCIRIVNFYQFL